jgi:hypothetical protein
LAAAVKQAKQLTSRGEIARRRAMVMELPDDPEIEAAIARFAADGFARLDGLTDQAEMTALLAETNGALGGDEGAATDKFGSHKAALWTHAIDSAMVDGRLNADSALARAALQPRILSVIARSLGIVPRLDYVTVTVSKPMIEAPSHSQLWHRDYDDTRVIKVFVYLSNVETLQDGPFTFLPAGVSDRLGFSMKSHRSDGDLPSGVDLERDMVRVMGPQFSCFMVETSRCLHMGSRVAPGHGRLMYTATYYAPPRIYPEPKPLFRPTGSESALELAVLLPAS